MERERGGRLRRALPPPSLFASTGPPADQMQLPRHPKYAPARILSEIPSLKIADSQKFIKMYLDTIHRYLEYNKFYNKSTYLLFPRNLNIG